MCQSCFDVIQWVGQLLQSVVIIVLLIILIEVDKVGITIVVASLSLGAVMGKVPLLSTLETCIVSHIAWWPLRVGYPSSDCISSSLASPVVWGMGVV